jgi:hypothetical protein
MNFPEATGGVQHSIKIKKSLILNLTQYYRREIMDYLWQNVGVFASINSAKYNLQGGYEQAHQ